MTTTMQEDIAEAQAERIAGLPVNRKLPELLQSEEDLAAAEAAAEAAREDHARAVSAQLALQSMEKQIEELRAKLRRGAEQEQFLERNAETAREHLFTNLFGSDNFYVEREQMLSRIIGIQIKDLSLALIREWRVEREQEIADLETKLAAARGAQVK